MVLQEQRSQIKQMLSDDAGGPNSDRTDDEKIIGDNFTKKYTEVYKKKNINENKLNELFQNLDWRLAENEMQIMSAPISPQEVFEVIQNLPSDK